MPTGSADRPRPVARSIGCAVPRPGFGFRVHSVFESALNLKLNDRRFLVTVLPPDAAAYPQGIRLATRARFAAWPVSPGTRGRRDGDGLVFGDERDARPFRIDLPAAAAMPCEPPPRIDPRGDAWWGAWQECAALVNAAQDQRGADLRLGPLVAAIAPTPATPFGARLTAAAARVADAVRARNVDAAARGASRLIGLGTGLTPTGDDFLCGWIAALWCASEAASAERRFVLDWGAALLPRLAATNLVSATFLECTIAGCLSGALADLAIAIQHGHAGEEQSRRATQALCTVGHSSGVDTATGFLFGLWIRNAEESRRYAA